MSDLSKIEEQVKSIPSMGGLKIGPFLRKAAKKAKEGTSIVEVGTWLGSGSAQLALGIMESGKDVTLHCYDRWVASEGEVGKAKKAGLSLEAGQDTLPVVKNHLAALDADIRFHKGDIREITWDKGPISVYVDDASKGPALFQHVLRTFGPHFIPGRTVLFLMDYHYWEKHPDKPAMRCQRDFMEAHTEHFTMVGERSTKYSMAQFLYTKKLPFKKVKIEA